MQPSTFERYSFALAAGASQILGTFNRNLTLVSITGATTVTIGLNDEPAQTWRAGLFYELPGVASFTRVRVTNNNPGGVTVELIMSQGRVGLIQDQPIAATLAAIQAELEGQNTALAYIPEVNMGVLAAQIVAAAATPRKVCVQYKNTGTGVVYIGTDATVTSTNWLALLLPGMSVMFDQTKSAIWGIASLAAQPVGGHTL